MLCSEIMKRDVECVSPTEPAHVAAWKMRQQNVGFLPVCSREGKVIGTVTDRDIAVRLVAEKKAATTPVSDVMTHHVISCRPSDEISIAEELMAKNRVSRMICLDESGRLMGVLSLSDLAQLEGEALAAQTLRRVSSREARP
jgi:CBS domain-containing protein